jgi:hypothetical protein
MSHAGFFINAEFLCCKPRNANNNIITSSSHLGLMNDTTKERQWLALARLFNKARFGLP